MADLVNTLHALLANYHVHYQKLRNFHWNVKGSDFFDLHEKFEEQEEQYHASKIANYEIAVRVSVFGGTPLSTMRDFLDNAEIKDSQT
ncbi:MAG: starvation-inducible DNA-binding protein [Cyclobacteriaceae bacterium]|jgi:starvation-inducible DNA-binding protein